MRININNVQKKLIKKFVTRFHGKEHVDTFKVFMAIAYLVATYATLFPATQLTIIISANGY